MKTVFEKTYSAEELADVDRDICEAWDNPAVADIPTDEHGFQEGSFKVTIVWMPEDEAV